MATPSDLSKLTVMLLAAGRGERMRPLTEDRPKPLLSVAGRSLLDWHLHALAQAGARRVVINHAYLGQQIVQAVGDGSAWGLKVRFSAETEALETAGGIATAQPWRDAPDSPFLVINADVWTDWPRARALHGLSAWQEDPRLLAWIWLVDNPAHHPEGDFHLEGSRVSVCGPGVRLTYAGIGLYHARLFSDLAPGRRAPLGPLLRQAAEAGRVGGARLEADWVDVGTPERLRALEARLKASPGKAAYTVG